MSTDEIIKALYDNPQRSKFGVDLSAKGKEDRTWDGIVFASKREMECYRNYIKPNVNAGLFHDLQFQVKFPLHVVTPGGFKEKVGSYVADFTVRTRDEELVVIEAKGHETPLWRRNKRHFEGEYGLRITVI